MVCMTVEGGEGGGGMYVIPEQEFLLREQVRTPFTPTPTPQLFCVLISKVIFSYKSVIYEHTIFIRLHKVRGAPSSNTVFVSNDYNPDFVLGELFQSCDVRLTFTRGNPEYQCREMNSCLVQNEVLFNW